MSPGSAGRGGTFQFEDCAVVIHATGRSRAIKVAVFVGHQGRGRIISIAAARKTVKDSLDPRVAGLSGRLQLEDGPATILVITAGAAGPSLDGCSVKIARFVGKQVAA